MASPYTGQFGDWQTGIKKFNEYTNELENLRKQAEQGQIPQNQYISRFNELKPILEKERYALVRISSDFNSAYGSDFDRNASAMKYGNIYSNARDILGRDINANELAQFVPYFGTGNQQDIETGRAALAQLAQQEANSPKALQGKAPQYSGDINSIFNDLLKRGASPDEINHFGSMLASGQVDAYTLRQFVQQLPEYTSAQDQASRERLNQELSQYDQEFFNKGKEDILSRYAKAGIQNSPSLDFALTNLMGDIQKERSAYLSKLAREDYSRGRDVQRDDYLTSLKRMFGEQDYGRQRSDSYSDLLLNRGFASQDYQRQQDDLLRLLSNQPRQSRGGIGQLVGGLVGAGVGYGLSGNPMGASTGYQIGSGGGGIYDYLNY